MMHFSQKTNTGFTLVEIIIVVFLFGAMLVGLLSIFEWQQKIYTVEMAEIRVTSDARSVISNMNTFMAQGIEVVASRIIEGTEYTTGGGTVIVRLPVIVSGGDVLADQFDYVVFHRDGTFLKQIIEAHPSSIRDSGIRELSSSVHNFSLNFNSGNLPAVNRVDVAITNRAYYRGDKFIDFSLSHSIFLRNN